MDDDEVSKFKFGVLKSLEVTNEIAQITKASENLCLYSAMYNALRSSTLREAFSSFNPFCAAKEFVELSKTTVGECTGYKPIDRAKHGYTTTDMSRYLQQIKSEGHIQTYKFYRIEGHKYENVFTLSHYQ